MKVKELIEELTALHTQYGDIEVCGVTYDGDEQIQRIYLDRYKGEIVIEYDKPRELLEIVATHQPIVRIGEPKRPIYIQLNFTV